MGLAYPKGAPGETSSPPVSPLQNRKRPKSWILDWDQGQDHITSHHCDLVIRLQKSVYCAIKTAIHGN